MKNTVEVFDTETQTWDPDPIPCSEINDYRFLYCRSIWIDRNLHVAALAGKALAYISKEDRWDTVEPWMENQISPSSYCKIENVVYSASQRELLWYDTEVSMWRDLKGLVGLPKLIGASCVRLADYGGKLALLWDDELPNDPFTGFQTLIWC
ncbi:PREDICTED: F-box/kelch-repeat protein At5g51250-like [Camelina sativa]|uniref:F-box/kelch-repeat protein At5g51250-like n=1 Tax=Camelina sativa TaxID=90675 RepID=A0ABM0XRI0_CAMSA|nr:PREDICTED: F-box/kelch-repeat protein At5g51250-like [Camelina sativa]